jgi:hypothetical protein
VAGPGGVLGITPKACRPYRAQTKGKVERVIRELKQDFLAWLTGQALPPRPTLADYVTLQLKNALLELLAGALERGSCGVGPLFAFLPGHTRSLEVAGGDLEPLLEGRDLPIRGVELVMRVLECERGFPGTGVGTLTCGPRRQASLAQQCLRSRPCDASEHAVPPR